MINFLEKIATISYALKKIISSSLYYRVLLQIVFFYIFISQLLDIGDLFFASFIAE